MISRVSFCAEKKQNFKNKINNLNTKTSEKLKNNKAGCYAESFAKNSVKSAPIILGMTGALSYLQKGANNSKIKENFKHNLKNFFVPVLLCSSLLLAGIENSNKNRKE